MTTPKSAMVPTRAGWWWRDSGAGKVECEEVDASGFDGRLMHSIQFDSDSDEMHGFDVTDDGYWRGPCLTQADLDAATKELCQLLSMKNDTANTFMEQVKKLQAQNTELRDALEKYGRHLGADCPASWNDKCGENNVCTCGFTDALKGWL